MRAGRDLAVLAVLVLAALFLPALAARQARPAVLNLGPNDFDYVRGFREDWERDRLTRFHWTTPHAVIRLPLAASGEGLHLSMRIRRHLIEPSKVTIRAEDRIVSVFDIQADPQVAYRTIAVDLPRLEGRRPFLLTIDSSSADPRPLGIAIDWFGEDSLQAPVSDTFRLVRDFITVDQLDPTEVVDAMVALVEAETTQENNLVPPDALGPVSAAQAAQG